jgi:hypothetical protein
VKALTGDDPTADIAEAVRLLPGMSDSQYASYVHWAQAWAALSTGRLADAAREARSAGRTTNYFVPITHPLAARAAAWAGDLDAAREITDELDASVIRGQARGLDLITLRAGIAALEGRRAEAVAGYRDALRAWRALGCAFDEALAAVDLAILLAPTEKEMAEGQAAIDWARETLTRLGATPLLERLEAGQQVASNETRTSSEPAKEGAQISV